MKPVKDEVKKLEVEINHLEKTFKTGIIKKEEYEANREKLMKKLNKAASKNRLEKESKKMINDILSSKTKDIAEVKVINREKIHGEEKSSKASLKASKQSKEISKVSNISKESVRSNEKSGKTIEKKFSEKPVPVISKLEIVEYKDERFWNILIYGLIIILIMVIIFTGMKYNSNVIQDDAVVKIYEFSDLESENAKDLQKTLRMIKEEYGDKVKIIFKHFPLEEIHPNALIAAEALECAAEQGQFAKFHNKLFNAQKELTEENIKLFATETMGLNIDSEVFNNCLDNHEKLSKVKVDIEEGTIKGVTAVPTLFIGNE